jgi:translation initiation factor eIF-2B subunit epsilon
LLGKLSDTVKLVGPTINCQGAPFQGDPEQHWRNNPHIPSQLIATDQVGMALLLQDRNLFRCYNKLPDIIYYTEKGLTKTMLDAGYDIDSLMVSVLSESARSVYLARS